MSRSLPCLFAVLGLMTAAQWALASTIDPTDKFAYAQSTGWMNLRPDQSGGGEGVTVTLYHLSGKSYGQSTGWVEFGDGTPADGLHYSNTGAADVGVNVDALFNLSGYAYGQSIGWINLSGLKLNNLERPDNDFDGISDAWEILHFGNTFIAGYGSDSDQDGQNDAAEYLAGTDPLDGASHFSASPQIQADFFQITFPSVPSRRYTIESSQDLSIWSALAPLKFAPDAGSSTTRLIPVSAEEIKNFYRVSASLPLSGGGGGGGGIGIGP